MFVNGKKVLRYAAKLCIFGVMAIIVMKLLGKNMGDSVIPILILAVAGNGISYVLYKPKQ